jgi:hypothetical protein
LLRWWSQATNVKLKIVAERLTKELLLDGHQPHDSPDGVPTTSC